MRTSNMIRSGFRLMSAVTLLALAGMKQLPHMDALTWAKWQCGPMLLAALVRAVVWAFSDQGRAVITAAIAVMATLSFLRGHPLPEARELAVAILALLAFLFLVSLSKEADNNHRVCAQITASLGKHEPVKP
jgi:hypothetical protein